MIFPSHLTASSFKSWALGVFCIYQQGALHFGLIKCRSDEMLSELGSGWEIWLHWPEYQCEHQIACRGLIEDVDGSEHFSFSVRLICSEHWGKIFLGCTVFIMWRLSRTVSSKDAMTRFVWPNNSVLLVLFISGEKHRCSKLCSNLKGCSLWIIFFYFLLWEHCGLVPSVFIIGSLDAAIVMWSTLKLQGFLLAVVLAVMEGG